MFFIGFIFFNLALVAIQSAISLKGYYKSSLTLTVSFTLVILIMTPYIDLIVISYVICVQFWIMSLLCFLKHAIVLYKIT
ncbi:hypothetical protein [Lysinibacillus sp. SGAir0095]|uniref:hypothetical protein n=1 Tax=Lysinibacillus sp. SGAir0095 TaxID=2070463 RepID=UPI0010F54AA7|nr:hypothetical protein [Lysinibacillus sp. SGAir0095]